VTRDTTKASSVALDVPPRVRAERGPGRVWSGPAPGPPLGLP